MKNTKKNIEKPSKEAKALSLFLMAYKSIKPIHKEESKRINKLWDQVKNNELDKNDYQNEIQKRVDAHGGYDAIVEKTVKYYLDKTGEWNLKGDDQYCMDAKQVVAKISKP